MNAFHRAIQSLPISSLRLVWISSAYAAAMILAFCSKPVLGADAAVPDVAVTLDTFTVEQTKFTEANNSTLKLPLPLHETPRSVTVLDEARLREQDFQTLSSALDYVPGVFGFGDNNDSYHFFARGFNMGADETKVDGFTGFVSNGSFSPSLFGVDQVVFLRGPAGLLYGTAAAPGGMINLITKKPQRENFGRFDVGYSTYAGRGVNFGSHASQELEVDVNRRLTSDGRLLFRFNGEIDNRGYYNDRILDRSRFALVTLTWKFGPEDRFELTPVFQYDRQPFAEGRGLVISPSTSLGTAGGRTGPINLADLTPLTNLLAAGERRLEHHIAGFDFRARFTPSWRASFAYRYMATDSDVNQFSVQTASLRQLAANDPHSWVVDRRQASSQTDRRNHSFDLSTSYEVTSDLLQNLTQFGVNGRFFRTVASRSAATQSNQSPVNIYTGVAATPLVDRDPALVDAFLNDDFYWNGWVQNQTSFHDRLILTVGLGYGEQHFGRDYPAGQTPPINLPQLTATRRGELTPNAAIVYKITVPLALYTSYSTSYQPADGSFEDSNGSTGNFQPVTGRNLELGAKYDFARRRGSLTTSVFETELTDVLLQSDATQLNRNGNRYYTQSGGGRRARGAELSAEFRPLANYRITGTASLLDARYHGEGRIPGSLAEKTPRRSFSLYQRYDFTSGALKKLGTSLGVVWQDERLSAARTSVAPDPLMLPGYTRFDAALFYRLDQRWDLSVNCQNLFDRLYFVSGSTGAALEIGAPRNLSFRISYRL
jgi:TonB-dependent siderophore receptor